MSATEHKTWKLADIGTFLRNSFTAILQGELLMRLKLDKVFVHILYVFFLLGLLILMSLGVEHSLNKVEENKKVLQGLEVIYSDKTYEVAGLSRRSTVQKMLQEQGSQLQEPDRPATVMKKK
ncbi:MAG: hypothetical protein II095_01140 [Bacteroidales bacterium]|jgi:hypothetical protein|nr:hypothetical protein [Bacteroidales bacterium]